MSGTAQLVDRWGRRHTDLRISVTDRCNLRCAYCVGTGPLKFVPKSSLLTFEEIVRIVRVATSAGVGEIRLTGGEPLARRGLPRLVGMLREVPGLRDIALTTNGTLLAPLAIPLRQAGLDRVNISLDTLSPEKYHAFTGGDLTQVLRGIEAALEAGFRKIKLNAVAIRDFTEEEIIPLAEFARQKGLEIRFIELMPLDDASHPPQLKPLPAEEILKILEANYGPLVPDNASEGISPSGQYRFPDGEGKVGILATLSQPFCGHCNRLRLSAEGLLRFCLFAREGWNLRETIRSGASDEEILQIFAEAIQAKWKERPHLGLPGATLPAPMYRCGG
jgi:cyclic pyranopterin phosphate synthase